MRTFTTTKVEEIKKEVNSQMCDFCGKKILGIDGVLHGDITSFEINPGWGSRYDMDACDFDICDDCLEELMAKRDQTRNKKV
jgi:hypothetical protein